MPRAVRGYRAVLVMSEIQSVERRRIMNAFGAELVLTPASEGTAGARKRLKLMLAEHPDYFYVGQHQNPSNPLAHYETTGPELWDDTDGAIDIFVAGLGTGGTLCGAGRFLKERKPGVRLVAVEPEEAPFISEGKFQPHRMTGTAPGFVPETVDRAIIDEFALVSEARAFELCRRIAREEGLPAVAAARAEDNAPVGQIRRFDVVVRAVGQLTQSRALRGNRAGPRARRAVPLHDRVAERHLQSGATLRHVPRPQSMIAPGQNFAIHNS